MTTARVSKKSKKKVDMNTMTFKMETLDGYMSIKMPFISSVSFSDTQGKSSEYTFKGGFEIKGIDDYVFYNMQYELYPALEETVDEVLFQHYNKICEDFLEFLHEGIDARDCDAVTFTFKFNEKSLGAPRDTIVWYDFETKEFIPMDEKGLFYMNPSTYNFYDLVVKLKRGDEEEVYDEVKGIPHFMIPAFIRTIGIWLGFAE